MKKHGLYIAVTGLLSVPIANAQLLTNDGAAIFSNPGALIFVDGEMLNQGSGTYDNSGAIELTGDWTNNAGNTAFINGSPGSVTLTGGAQNIKGTDPTVFYDLILTGTGNKTQQVNATVTDSLALNDKELATDTFLMHVTNTSLTSITRTTGFVSSLDTGGLARDMANAATYLFPVGSSIGVPRYRPVEIAPSVATSHTYKVRMANVDATTEGYDRTINDSTFCVINPDYYHRIYQTAGSSPADVSIYYDNALDNAYQAIAHWQNLPRWEDISPVANVANVSPTLSYMTKSAWNDYSYPAFALGTTSPVVSLSANDTSICMGDTLTFSASSGFSNYEFFNNSVSVQNGALNTYQVTGLSTGDTIKVTATDLSCTAFSNELVIIVNPLPVVDATAMVITPESCGGANGSITGIAVTGSSPFTYQWLDGSSGTVGGDSANVMNLPPDGYSLTVTDVNGCSAASGVHTVTGSPGPVIDTTSMLITSSTCGNSNGSITGVTASGGVGTLTYDWTNSVPVSVGGNADLNGVPAGSYILTVTDSLGCTDATPALTVTDLGGPLVSLASLVITPATCGNNNGSITGIAIAGNTPFTFDWQDGSLTTVGTNLDLTSVPPDNYILTVTDSSGCTITSGPHTVGDEPGPVLDAGAIVIAMSTCGVSDGSITGITVSGGTGTLTFNWINTAPSTVGTAIDLNAVPADSYLLTVTDSNGCTDVSGPHTINDAGAPIINASAIVIDSSRCDLPTGAITGITVSGGVAPLTYVWNDPSLQSTLNATGLACNTYTFLVTDASGCIATSGPHMVPCFSAPPAPVAPSPSPYCTGDPVADLTATGTTGTINWYSDAPLSNLISAGSPFASGASSDTSFWVAETRNGCVGNATQVDIVITPTPPAPFAGNDTALCFGAVVIDTINVIGGIGAEWWADAGLTVLLGTGDSLQISPVLGVNIYYVTQSVGTCRGPYDSVIVTLDTPVTGVITGLTDICEGDATTLTASGGTGYLWSTTATTPSITVSPVVTTVYNVIVSGGACTATVTDTVTVNSLPVATITGLNSLCAGVSLTLSAGLEQSYLWNTSPVSTTQIITVTPPSGTITTYTLTVTNGCGVDSATHSVSVEAPVDAGTDIDLCKNTDTAGYAATGLATPLGGTWSSPDTLVFPGNLQPNGFLDHIAIPWGSGYELVYTSSSGNCSDTLLLEVTGSNAGVDSIVCPGTATFFLPASKPGGGAWSSPDAAANNNIIDPLTGEVIKEGLAGDYVFVYTTFGASKGCPDSVVVNVCGDNDIWVPNIFSPNGDNQNDIMFVRGIAVDWVHIKIYDRWGELVYDSGQGRHALEEGWNGTFKGKELTPQVFVYYMDAAFLDGEAIETMKGNITLVK